MRHRLIPSCLLFTLLTPLRAQQDIDLTPFEKAQRLARKLDSWAPHRSLRVLYAGSEGGHRWRVFQKFLAEHFDETGAIPLAELSMQTAKDYDVVIADWVSQYGCEGYPKREGRLFSPPISLGPEFTKPLIAMSYVAARLRGGYKLNWH